MRFLGALGLGAEHSSLHVVGAVLRANRGGGALQGFLTQIHRIRTHVGDESVFVKPLSQRHGAVHGEAQFAGGFLLQRRGGEGGSGFPGGGFLFEVGHVEGLAAERGEG